ncbi:MAG: mechanosensitive ion channel family protein [Nannocystaceae bacterium]|nr:mechanosensitive ion channel family protein [Nannocystaceae bacterium]
MTEYLFRSIVDLTFLTLGAMVLIGLLQLIAFLFRVVPAPARVRDGLQRFAPVLGLTLLVAYIASGLAALLAREPAFAAVLVSLIGTLVLFSWASLYDLVSGVAFRFERLCQVGDHVRVGDVEGRVLNVGMRSLIVQTPEGDEAVVPYGKISRETLRRTQSVSGAHVHAFAIEQPQDVDFVSLKCHVVRSAMRCHWASVVHEPKVERRERDTIEVSIYALDADHAPVVEAAVRRALASGVLQTQARVGAQLPSATPGPLIKPPRV